MDEYITVQGDTWDIIAREQLGDEKYIGQLIDCNLKYIDMVIFSAGVSLAIPEIDSEEEEDTDLPPWRVDDDE
ncbi:hypothetical protein lbkm_0691 [Lachnospiraceae bacterium KM106-2]|nr:hypothetical protein lbkm_0691 [Lachnospiraceae bacterium KM106-2]